MSKKKHKPPQFQLSDRLDLHGYIVHDGFLKTREFLGECKYTQKKYVRVITGQSGQMAKEFPTWMETMGYSIVETGFGHFTVKTF